MAAIRKHVTRDVVTLEARAPIRDAARMMADRKIGSVAVREDGKIVGLVTERDLVLTVLAESAWDSNVTLAPAGAVPGPQPDAVGALTATALWRPRGAAGPYARAAGATSPAYGMASPCPVRRPLRRSSAPGRRRSRA